MPTLLLDDIVLPHFHIPVEQLYNPPTETVSEMTRGGKKIKWIKSLKEIPFDIKCPDDVFCTGETLQKLYVKASAAVETTTHVLTITDTGTATYTLKLRLEDKPVISANPVIEYVPQTTDSACIYSGLLIKCDRILA